MSSTPEIQSQSLVTQSIGQLMEFDFTSIGGSSKVYIANTQENETGTYEKLDITWTDGIEHTFEWIDFSLSNLRSDLTGQVSEPQLRIAAHENSPGATAACSSRFSCVTFFDTISPFNVFFVVYRFWGAPGPPFVTHFVPHKINNFRILRILLF